MTLALPISPLPLLICFVGWEVLYRVCGLLFSRYATHLVVEGGSGSAAKLVKSGPSYAVSLLHAMLMSAFGVLHVAQMLPSPPYAKLSIVDDPSDPWHAATTAIETTNYFFLSYVLNDLLHVLVAYPNLGGADVLLHHAGFIATSCLCSTYRILPFAFGWLLLGEFSTLPLNIRWFRLTSGRTAVVTSWLFAATFLVARILVNGAGLAHLWATREPLLQLAVPRPLLLAVLALVAASYLLNLFWFKKIVAMAAGGGAHSKSQGSSLVKEASRVKEA